MISVAIPGYKELHIKYIVSDYNGTLAIDGRLIADAIPLIKRLAEDVDIHVITADTFGLAKEQLAGLPLTLKIMPKEDQDRGKLDYIKDLGAEHVASLGNGRNDKLMLRESALGICLLQTEGASVQSMIDADILVNSAQDALALLLNPKRLIATLRI